MIPSPALEVQNVTRRFGSMTALNGLTFSVAPGQTVGLLGRNGAGKSTLLRILSGQLRAHEGEVKLFGQTVQPESSLSQLCLIGDTPDFGKLSNIKELFYVCGGLFPHWDQSRAEELLSRFELPEKKRLKGFSRGMQTALLLSVGLASGAPLTVFDEPSLGLDAVMRERFYDLLWQETHATDAPSERTFILSTHLIEEVARVLDSAVLIDSGRLLTQGTVAELTESYLSVSGQPDAVRAATEGLTVLREEEMAGSLVRHLRLNSPADRERLTADPSIQTAPMSLQRLFVFLTEAKEAERHG